MEPNTGPDSPLVSPDRDGDSKSAIVRIEGHVARRVLSGFLVLIPLLVTFVVFRLIFAYVHDFFRPFVLPSLPEATPSFTGWIAVTAVGASVTLGVFYVIGAFFSGERSRAWQDAILKNIPVAGSIYGVARQATEGLASPTGHHYSRVVFIEWPRPGVKALGFVTGHLRSAVEGGTAVVVIYIPTVPNPTSGMLAWVPEHDVIEADISVEEAMKAVFSGGIVLPEIPAPRSLLTSRGLDELEAR